MFDYKYIINIKSMKNEKYNVIKQIFYKNSLYKTEKYCMNKKQIKKLIDYNYIII
jgi:hypothetical protein